MPIRHFILWDNQVGGNFRLHVVVATNLADPRLVIPEVRAASAQKMDPQLAFTVGAGDDEVIAATLTRQKLGTTLMLLFGMVALLLAAIGIYGMIAYSSAERHSEVATENGARRHARASIFAICSRDRGSSSRRPVRRLVLGNRRWRRSAGAPSWLYEGTPVRPTGSSGRRSRSWWASPSSRR